MARAPRVDFEGAIHHVMNRGARRAPIFRRDEDCGLFLLTLAETVERFGIEVHAYALMPNHFHLLIRSVRGNLSRAMRHLLGTYTQTVNRAHAWDGPVFRGRFRNQRVRDRAHLLTVVSDIHLNPVRAGLVRRLDQHAWTSHRAYIGLDALPGWLSVQTVLDEIGGKAAFSAYVQALRVGGQPWPPDFQIDSGGWLNENANAPPWTLCEGRSRRPAIASGPEAEAVLARACALTGASRTAVIKASFGPRANPARRFAAWALSFSSDATQREIGRLLDMSTSQVAKVIAAARREPASLRVWMDRWRLESSEDP